MQKKKIQDNTRTLRIAMFIFSAIILAIGFTVFLKVKTQPFCANSISCIKDLSGKKSEDNTGISMGGKVTAPMNLPDTPEFALNKQYQSVLGDATGGNKHIYVDLTNQRLYAFDGNKVIYNFIVSTGKWNPTPTGEFHIWIWLRYTRMTGGSQAKGDYYDLPNVPYTMYFYNDSTPKAWGYSLHGAYWHNNFGHPMSHGCVNMKIEDAQQIYYWTAQTPDVPITVYGTTPQE
jgi:hypothetical protein